MKSALTVLMPVHNAEQHLEGAICSILEQRFEDFDFLMIDDGSTDRSLEIIRSFSDPRIRCLRNESRRGIAATLNRGIEATGTELIARMDADDIAYPERIGKQYHYMKEHPECALVSTLTRNIAEDGTPLAVDPLKSEFFYYNLTFYSWIYHPTVMYRRSVIRELGLHPLGFAEDYRLWCRLIREYPFWNLPEVLLDYRISKKSTSNVFGQEYGEDEKQQVLENLRYFLGCSYVLPDAWLECYRNNFEPIVLTRSRRQVILCVKELERITAAILQKENPNRDAGAIKRAARAKKRSVLCRAVSGLTLADRVLVLASSGAWRMLACLLGRLLYRRATRSFTACLTHFNGARPARRRR